MKWKKNSETFRLYNQITCVLSKFTCANAWKFCINININTKHTHRHTHTHMRALKETDKDSFLFDWMQNVFSCCCCCCWHRWIWNSVDISRLIHTRNTNWGAKNLWKLAVLPRMDAKRRKRQLGLPAYQKIILWNKNMNELSVNVLQMNFDGNWLGN